MKNSDLIYRFGYLNKPGRAVSESFVQDGDYLYLANSDNKILLGQRIKHKNRTLILLNIRFKELKVSKRKSWGDYVYNFPKGDNCSIIEISSTKPDRFTQADFVYELLAVSIFSAFIRQVYNHNLYLLPFPKSLLPFTSVLMRNTPFSISEFVEDIDDNCGLLKYMKRNGVFQILRRIHYRTKSFCLHDLKCAINSFYPIDSFYNSNSINKEFLLFGLLLYGIKSFSIKCEKILSEYEELSVHSDESHSSLFSPNSSKFHQIKSELMGFSRWFDPPLYTSKFEPIAKLFSIVEYLNQFNMSADRLYTGRIESI